jgi:adenylate cyclase
MRSGVPKSLRLLLTYVSISLAVAALIFILTEDIIFEFPPLKRAELSLVDLRFQQRGIIPHIADSSNVVIVEINQESYKSLPEKWPWPKDYYARLVRNLKRAGAKAVGIDIVFTSSDSRDSARDAEFRRAISEAGNVILAGKLESEQRLYSQKQNIENYGNAFIDSGSTFGLVNVRSDVDGVLRRYMPFVYDAGQQKRVPTFSLATLNVFFHKDPAYTVDTPDKAFLYGSRVIPQYNETSFLINYYGHSGTFRRINIADVLDDHEFLTKEELSHPGEEINTFDDTTMVPRLDGPGEVPAGYLYNGTFAGKIVLIGSTMPEEKDLFPVTVGEGRQDGDNQMYGVEIHANVIQEILDRNFITRQPKWISALVVFGLCLFSFTLTAGLKAIKTRYSAMIEILGVTIVCSELFIIYWAAVKFFVEQRYLVEMMSPFLAIVVSYVGSTVYNYVSERKQKVLIKGMFRQYVNPTIVDELVAHPEKLQLGGERKEITVFFSDIENFTHISEKMVPENLVAILNEYLSVMTAIIFSNQGTLDKYEGDAIVAFWGAPVPQHNHALRACRAAIDMQRSLKGLRQVWKEDGKPQLNVRIGINTGEVIVGNMGGASRFDYTVIGDSVNLGSRLESANKQYHSNIMISESTFRKVEAQVIARELDMLVVSGKTEPIRVYELIGMRGDSISSTQAQLIEHYTNGLTLYRQREWQRAIKAFEEALEIVPDDYPSQLYIERSHLYLSSPPPDDWNGVFILRTK